jgi:hypothetical protein
MHGTAVRRGRGVIGLPSKSKVRILSEFDWLLCVVGSVVDNCIQHRQKTKTGAAKVLSSGFQQQHIGTGHLPSNEALPLPGCGGCSAQVCRELKERGVRLSVFEDELLGYWMVSVIR